MDEKTIGWHIDQFLYERTKSVGQYVDDILYSPGPITRWVAFGAGGAAGIYVVHKVFKRLH